MIKHIALAAILGLSSAGTVASTPASADGFISGLLRDTGIINEDQRRMLDNAHEAAGKPLDRAGADAAGAASDAVVPGSGPVVRQQLLNRSFPNGGAR